MTVLLNYSCTVSHGDPAMCDKSAQLPTPTNATILDPPTLPDPPWARMPNEPPRYYTAFNLYRALGPRRSILAAYREYLKSSPDAKKNVKTPIEEIVNAPSTWYSASTDWHWPERAAKWDEHNIAALWDNEQQLAAYIGRLRVHALLELLQHCRDMLPLVDPNRNTTGAIGAAMKTALGGLRDEMGESTTTKQINVDIIVHNLPDELQPIVARALESAK